MAPRCTMRRADVFRGTGDTSRLQALLLADTREQTGCVGDLLASVVEDLAGDVAELAERLAAVEAHSHADEATTVGARRIPNRQSRDYLVFLGTPSGYRLSETSGVLPEVGSSIVELGATVLRVGPSPFPGDPRACIFAIA